MKTLPTLALAAAVLLFGAKPPHFAPANGNWWENASYERQGDFLVGYSSCEHYLLKKKGPLLSSYALQKSITDFYDAHTRDLRVPVANVIARLDAEWWRNGRYRFGRWAASGSPDGNFGWRGPEGQKEIVDGFRACEFANDREVSTAPAATLVGWINRWLTRRIRPTYRSRTATSL